LGNPRNRILRSAPVYRIRASQSVRLGLTNMPDLSSMPRLPLLAASLFVCTQSTKSFAYSGLATTRDWSQSRLRSRDPPRPFLLAAVLAALQVHRLSRVASPLDLSQAR